MNRNSEKHKKIVRQRIMTAVITLLILGVVSVGIYYAAQILLMKAKEQQQKTAEKEPVPQVAEETEKPENEPEIDWYVSENEADPDTVSAPEISQEDQKVKELIESMSLDERICQLFIVKADDLTGVENTTAARDATKAALEKYPVGGIIYFEANIIDPDQLGEMLKNTSEFAKELGMPPLFLCIDEENGSITRIASNDKFDVPRFPSMYDMSLSDNAADTVYDAGLKTGSYLKEYGFNLNFAPVADVVTSSENSAIGTRSFGAEPDEVSKLSLQYAKGLEESGIIPCFKHFPGLGDTETDTHLGLASTRKTEKELDDSGFIPFANAAENGAKLIMAGHISAPLLTGDDTPSSLSDVMINAILREKMGYDGVVITDSLQMKSVTDNYTVPEAVKMAIKAGADIILMPEDLESAVNALKDAVKTGEIKEERIDDSLQRILKLKLSLQ
ncbi:MAG: glycoside hydrolase family 3 protein [Lachnospiraceae bacterium]|nr:glycoside hydrolase family 3 protein [Lachnospiraceae bacterium]